MSLVRDPATMAGSAVASRCNANHWPNCDNERWPAYACRCSLERGHTGYHACVCGIAWPGAVGTGAPTNL